MEQIISKEELEEFSKLTGEVRGLSLTRFFDNLLAEEGKEGLDKLNKALEQLGDFKSQSIIPTEFYPIRFYAILILVLDRLFGYDGKKFHSIGRRSVGIPVFLRFITKYIVSADRAAKSIESIWKKYYTTGSLKMIEYNKKEGYAIVRLEGIKLPSLHCEYLKGNLSVIGQLATGKKISVQETKCIHKGDEYHEFLLKW